MAGPGPFLTPAQQVAQRNAYGPLGPSPVQRLTTNAPLYALPGDHPGLLRPGNIDINARPTVVNPDGSYSTVRSISVTDDQGRAYLLPTVINGRVVSPADAVRAFQRTGQHLGIFANEGSANRYGQLLHESQAGQYSPSVPSLAAMLTGYRR